MELRGGDKKFYLMPLLSVQHQKIVPEKLLENLKPNGRLIMPKKYQYWKSKVVIN